MYADALKTTERCIFRSSVRIFVFFCFALLSILNSTDFHYAEIFPIRCLLHCASKSLYKIRQHCTSWMNTHLRRLTRGCCQIHLFRSPKSRVWLSLSLPLFLSFSLWCQFLVPIISEAISSIIYRWIWTENITVYFYIFEKKVCNSEGEFFCSISSIGKLPVVYWISLSIAYCRDALSTDNSY